MLSDVLGRFRVISAIEGLSYLILVFIAMPIKYLGDNPIYVKFFGMAHGVLFIIFMISLLEVKTRNKWDTGFVFQIFVLSLIPFGAFIIENRVKPKEATIENSVEK